MSQETADSAAVGDTSVAEDDLRLALGPNAEPYLALWRRRSRLGLYGSWCWWGFLMPLPWLLYRKLWAVGSVLVLLPILCEAVLGTGAKAGFLLAALIGALGKPLVLDRSLRKVRRAAELGLVPAEGIERLRRAGGVSRPGALFGVLLTLSYLAVVFGYTRPLALPGCDDELVTGTTLSIARDSAAELAMEAADMGLVEIAEQDSSAAPGRLCLAELRSGDQRLAVEYGIVWQDRATNTISVDLRLRGTK